MHNYIVENVSWASSQHCRGLHNSNLSFTFPIVPLSAVPHYHGHLTNHIFGPNSMCVCSVCEFCFDFEIPTFSGTGSNTSPALMITTIPPLFES